MKKIVFCSLCLLLVSDFAFAQSNISINGGYLQSIFYSTKQKSDYYYSFSPYHSYHINITYKENVFQLAPNMRLGAQLEWKQQAQWIYREDVAPTQKTAYGFRYDIRSVNLYLFPEIAVGEKVKFSFSGGPAFQFVCQTKSKGKQVEVIEGEENKTTELSDGRSKDIRGFCFGLKLCLGIDIHLYKGLSLCFYNAYSAGLTSFNGNLKNKLNYVNGLDLQLGGGLSYCFNHKDWFSKKVKNINNN
ncbi:MAG: hypothetical protein J5606_06770 [Bacteroidales bacterium]|nr:hypothetical protein [Bacteroidales bacterium]